MTRNLAQDTSPLALASPRARSVPALRAVARAPRRASREPRALSRWLAQHLLAHEGDRLRAVAAGSLALLVMGLPLPWVTWSSGAGLAIWIACAVACAGAIGVAAFLLGDAAHGREKRRVGSRRGAVESLADLAAATPKPLLELSETGTITYMNHATRCLLAELGIAESSAHEALPHDVADHVARALAGPGEQVDWEVRGRVIHYAFQRVPGGRTVVAAGTDFTYLRRIESELRAVNLDLEAIVDARARETQEATALCLARLAEIRDPETGSHLLRTKGYVAALARHLATLPRYREALTEETIDLLMMTAPLHDIGKVGVPDSILCKPARLSHEETEAMQRHPTYGGDALEWVAERLGSSRFFDVAKEIAYYHHERWDGKGYPTGLSGEEIPIAARLMALADVYDALRSPRVYRPALPHEEVREIIVQERGHHFDPAVVDAFLATEETFEEIARSQADPEPVPAPIDAIEHAATVVSARSQPLRVTDAEATGS